MKCFQRIIFLPLLLAFAIPAIRDAEGNLIVTQAHIATDAEGKFAGQSEAWASARLWGRRLGLEPLATVTAAAAGGQLVYAAYETISD